MDVPEKLYGCYKGNGNLFVDYRPFPNDESIEYTRTDVFIEKALDFFENDLCCYIKAQDFVIDHKRLENDFKKAMKGE